MVKSTRDYTEIVTQFQWNPGENRNTGEELRISLWSIEIHTKSTEIYCNPLKSTRDYSEIHSQDYS